MHSSSRASFTLTGFGRYFSNISSVLLMHHDYNGGMHLIHSFKGTDLA